MPRGPLPARVYWTRRLLVIGVAFALVFAVGRLLGGDGDGSSGPSARPASAIGSDRPSDGSSTGSPTVAPARPQATEPAMPRRKKRAQALAMPTGPCADSDVRVIPDMEGPAHADDAIPLRLRLTTFEAAACNWRVSPQSLVVRVTSGDDRIWSSQDCPSGVPETDVVLRKRKPTYVDVTWSGRRSDADCSNATAWAELGWYHVAAAAMGSDPESQQFELRRPAPVTVTPTPTPRPGKDGKPAQKPARKPAQKPAEEPSEQPQG